MNHPGKATELGTLPVRTLLTQYSIPAIIGMTAASLYNMIDSIYIGHGVGVMAISALAVAFPLMNLAAAFGSLVGTGAATLISVRLGQKDYATAKAILGNVVVMNIMVGLIFGLSALCFLDPLLYFFGASPSTIDYARDFMRVILLGNVITHMYLGLNAVLRSSGHPHKAMTATINTVVFNVVLAPLFIYGFGWGIEGAALATVISQAISLVRQIVILSNKNELIHLQRGIYKLDFHIVRDMVGIGLSPFLMNLAACLVVILINRGLTEYGGDYHVGAYGIVNRVSFFFIMIIMGLNQGMQPIAGFNYGARQTDRVIQVLRITMMRATCVTTAGFLIGELCPHLVASAFTNDPTMIELASHGMRILVMCYPILGFQMVSTNFFQSLGMAHKSIFLSLTRQLLFLLPGLVFLPPLLGADGVWYSMPISDFLAFVVAAVMLWFQLKKFRRKNMQEMKTVKQSPGTGEGERIP